MLLCEARRQQKDADSTTDYSGYEKCSLHEACREQKDGCDGWVTKKTAKLGQKT
jgi:hypothetical protein